MPSESIKRTIAAVGGALLAPLLFGISIGFTSSTLDTLEGVYDVQGDKKALKNSDSLLSKDSGAWFSSIFNIGCLFGALIGGQLVERFGRRRTLVLSSPVSVASWIVIAISNSAAIAIGGRVINGLSVGMASVAAPMYIAEVAPTRLRGTLGAANQLAITIGIMLSYLIGLACQTTGETNDQANPQVSVSAWRTMSWIMVVPAVLLFIAMSLAPETPRWLANKGRLEDAKKNLNILRGRKVPDDNDEVLALRETSSQSSQSTGQQESPIEKLKPYRKQLFVGISLQILQQFVGINVVMFYMEKLIRMAKIDQAGMWAVIAGLVQIVFTFIACILMDRAGRKPLLLTGAGGLGISVFVMGLATYFIKAQSQTGLGWLFISSVMGYLAFFSIGVGPIPWLILGEIFPDKVRGTASTIATCVNWGCSFIMTFSTPKLEKKIEPYSQFFFYAGAAVVLVLITAFLIPETKGRTFTEIEDLFNNKPTEKKEKKVVSSA